MAEYKIIFKDENPKWQTGCPILVKKVQASRNVETAECYLQLRLANISGEKVGSIDLKATITPVEGEPETTELSILDADIDAGKELVPKAVKLDCNNISTIEIAVSAIDGEKIDEKLTPFGEQNPLTLSDVARNERLTLAKESNLTGLEDKWMYEDHETWWRCECGTPNVKRKTCVKCGLPQDVQSGLENEEQLVEKAKARSYAESLTALEGNDVAALRTAKNNLEKLAAEEYKDASELVKQCEPKIQKIEADREEHNKQVKKKIKRVTAIGVPVIVVLAIVVGLVAGSANQQKSEKVIEALQGISLSYGSAGTSSGKYTLAFTSDGMVTETKNYLAQEKQSVTKYVTSTYYLNGKKYTTTTPKTITETVEVNKADRGAYSYYTVNVDFFGNVVVNLDAAISCQDKQDTKISITLDSEGNIKSAEYAGNEYAK